MKLLADSTSHASLQSGSPRPPRSAVVAWERADGPKTAKTVDRTTTPRLPERQFGAAVVSASYPHFSIVKPHPGASPRHTPRLPSGSALAPHLLGAHSWSWRLPKPSGESKAKSARRRPLLVRCSLLHEHRASGGGAPCRKIHLSPIQQRWCSAAARRARSQRHGIWVHLFTPPRPLPPRPRSFAASTAVRPPRRHQRPRRPQPPPPRPPHLRGGCRPARVKPSGFGRCSHATRRTGLIDTGGPPLDGTLRRVLQ